MIRIHVYPWIIQGPPPSMLRTTARLGGLQLSFQLGNLGMPNTHSSTGPSAIPLGINLLLFQVGWLACALSAAQGRSCLGPAVVAVLIVIHLAFASDRGGEVLVLIGVAVLGTLLDTTLARLGVVTFSAAGSDAALCPMWVTVLWMNFATTLRGCLQWLSGRSLLARMRRYWWSGQLPGRRKVGRIDANG